MVETKQKRRPPERRRPLNTYRRPLAAWLILEMLDRLDAHGVADLDLLVRGLGRLGRLFRAGDITRHFLTRGERELGGRWFHNGSLVFRDGKLYPPKITLAAFMRHLLQGRNLHKSAVIWLHHRGEELTDRFVIDIDAKTENQVKLARSVYTDVIDSLGTPEFAVTSRGGRGFNLWYFLDVYAEQSHPEHGYETRLVTDLVSRVLQLAGLRVGSAGHCEVFPVVGTAMPAIPFGPNMYPLDERGRSTGKPSELAIVEWVASIPVDDTPMPDPQGSEGLAIRPLGRNAQDLIPIKRLASMAAGSGVRKPARHRGRRLGTSDGAKRSDHSAASPKPSAAKRESNVLNSAGVPPWHREKRTLGDIEPDFQQLDARGLTGAGQRRAAQLLLKEYSQLILRLPPDESARWAIQWFASKNNGCSTDYNRSGEGVNREILRFFTAKPLTPPKKARNRRIRPPEISREDFDVIVAEILQREDVVTALAAGKRKPSRFRKGLLSFLVHALGFARANGSPNKESFLEAMISTDIMKSWPLCSRDYNHYSKAARSRESYCQMLWMGLGERSSFRALLHAALASTPSSNFTPAMSFKIRWLPLMRRHRFSASRASLNTMANVARRLPQPLVWRCR